jgi:hypothetical protein
VLRRWLLRLTGPTWRRGAPGLTPSLGRVPPVAVSALAAASLVAGFAVAQATGVRALGGLVLLAAAAACAVIWRRHAGTGAAAGLVALYVAAFAASHVLAEAIGAWPSVLTVAGVVGAGSLVVLARAPSAPHGR